MNARPFLLLDRDGTLIQEREYLSQPEQVELIPGAIGLLRRAHQLGWGVAVVTNQSGVGRGYFTLDDVHAVHEEILRQLQVGGTTVDGFFICPHHPDEPCDCRKPLPGMGKQVAEQLGALLTESIMVGDRDSDLRFGKAIGATTVLVRTGYGALTEPNSEGIADYVVDDLRDLFLILGEHDRTYRRLD